MRNWNQFINFRNLEIVFRFYRTYEELKLIALCCIIGPLFLFLSYLWGIETLWMVELWLTLLGVFIVPMRNWNILRLLAWGISCLVFIVPMRNWNQKRSMNSMGFVAFSFLSYLWGIETGYGWASTHLILWFLSYLWGIETPPLDRFSRRSWDGFYRTYEELKHMFKSVLIWLIGCFYRTYEELKRPYFILWCAFKTLFLSYLWGIETLRILYHH